MKKIRIIVSVVLLVMICGAWVVQFTGLIKKEQQYEAYIAEAEEYTSKMLYQKAIETYDLAMDIRDTKELNNRRIETYECAYKDGVVTKKEFMNALNQASELYPKEAIYWEKLIEISLESSNYNDAYSYLEKAQKNNVESEKLANYEETIVYSYSVKKQSFNQVFRSTDGVYTLFDGTKWGVMDSAGEWIYDCEYEYISPVGRSLYVLLKTSKDSRVVSDKAVVQSISDIVMDSARAISEGYMLIQDGGWRYFDYEINEFVLSKYENASIFSNGVALVETKGQWNLIDTNGKVISDAKYDDVKLHENGEYLYEGLFLASQNGTYALYKQSGEKISDIQGKSVDYYLGEAIAFEDKDGKWGFVDKNNKVVIEPQFDEAKSFSSGVAAVRKGDKWGFINSEGKVIIDYQFLSGGYFSKDGLCFVSHVDGEYCAIVFRFAGIQ